MIQALFQQACATPSDINEHLPLIRRYAQACDRVTEFGVRTGVSTVALASAKPKAMRCYDVNPACAKVVEDLKLLVPSTDLKFIQADTGKLDSIEQTDLLFIDTLHTYEQVASELRLAPHVERFIILHDTVTYGNIGEDGGRGILDAIRQLCQGRDWKPIQWCANNNGLAVLERV